MSPTSYAYIGDTNTKSESVKDEYLHYVSPQNDASPFNSAAFEEFKTALQDISLSSDDVQGIRKVCVICYKKGRKLDSQ